MDDLAGSWNGWLCPPQPSSCGKILAISGCERCCTSSFDQKDLGIKMAPLQAPDVCTTCDVQTEKEETVPARHVTEAWGALCQSVGAPLRLRELHDGCSPPVGSGKVEKACTHLHAGTVFMLHQWCFQGGLWMLLGPLGRRLESPESEDVRRSGFSGCL